MFFVVGVPRSATSEVPYANRGEMHLFHPAERPVAAWHGSPWPLGAPRRRNLNCLNFRLLHRHVWLLRWDADRDAPGPCISALLVAVSYDLIFSARSNSTSTQFYGFLIELIDLPVIQ
jgi:hypothetical protein